jgi:transcription elongation GreA/GreB family factor
MTNISLPPVFASNDDFLALSGLGGILEGATAPGPSLLAAEMNRLAVVDPKAQAPFVRIGSRVTYCDVQRRRVRTARVVMPGQGSIHESSIPVTSPVGAALLGLGVDDVFSWWTSNGMRSVHVLGIGK